MKKTSVLLFVLTFAFFLHAEELGVKLAGSGACVRACGAPVVALSIVPDYQRLIEPRLTGNNLYCAINLVGRNCLDRMRERRMNDGKASRIQRDGKSKKESDYIAIDYLGCLMGQYNPQIEPCIYKE